MTEPEFKTRLVDSWPIGIGLTGGPRQEADRSTDREVGVVGDEGPADRDGKRFKL